MKSALAFSAALVATFAATSAGATQQCSALVKLDMTGAPTANPAGPVVYVTGSSALKPLLAALGRVMFSDPVSPITVVYRSQGSCLGVDAIVNGTPMGNAAGTTTASYWDPNSKQVADATHTLNEETCTLDMNQAADIGGSDVFAQTCKYALQGLAPGIKDFQGPIQSMTIAVPANSGQNTISQEAAYLTFGIAALAPWTDPTTMFIRNSGSGTQSMIGTAIGVDPTAWFGHDSGSSSGVYNFLTGPATADQATADKTIGILSSDYSSLTGVKQLYYQHKGQTCGYRPDNQPLDKKNTREGRYAIWGPIHLFTQIDGTGLAKNLQARKLIAYLTGQTPPPQGTNLIRLEANAHVVPPCAMKVQRAVEMGPMTPATPPVKCGCAFDNEAVGSTTCKPCTLPSDCGSSQTCSYGFCENN
jgi:hypothetical protein